MQKVADAAKKAKVINELAEDPIEGNESDSSDDEAETVSLPPASRLSDAPPVKRVSTIYLIIIN
jgi:hypothetical protein